jgi:hypothetical protein
MCGRAITRSAGRSWHRAQDTSAFAPYTWRKIGPKPWRAVHRRGRLPAKPNEYFSGATGGDLWKTTDGGTTWARATDGQIAPTSVGTVGVSVSHPDIVYVGMGEAGARGSIEGSTARRGWRRHVGELTHNPGLPVGVLGKMTVAVSPADPKHVSTSAHLYVV